MNRNLNKKIIFATTLFLAMLAFCIYFFTLIKNKNTHASMIETDIATAGARAMDLAKIKKSIEDSTEKRKEIDSYFVNQSGIADFLSSLEALGPLSGTSVVISNVEISDKSIADQNDKSPKTLKVSIRATGGFGQIYTLEKLMENAPYDLNILRSDMVRSDTIDDKGKTKISWNLEMDSELRSFVSN